MTVLASIFAIAFVTQKLTGFVIQTILAGQKLQAYVKELIAVAIGEGFAFLLGLNILPLIAQTFHQNVAISVPSWVAYAVTGAFIGGGSNLLYQVFPKPTKPSTAAAGDGSTAPTAGIVTNKHLW